MTREPSPPPAGVAFTVPGHPIPQPRQRATARVDAAGKARVRTYQPDLARSWKDVVALYGRLAVRGGNWPLDSEYAVHLTVRRSRRVGDVDNFAKAVLDGLNGIAWNDDRQVRELHVVIIDPPKKGGPEWCFGVDVRIEAGR